MSEQTVETKDLPKKEAYQLIRDLLKEHNLDGNPAYSGYGVEVYHSNGDEMIAMHIDWHTDKYRIVKIGG